MASYLRVLHASSDAPPIDLYDDNGNYVVQNLSYRDFSEYMPVTAGTYTIRCCPHGTEEPLMNTSFFVPDNSICTVATAGWIDNVHVLPIYESPVSISPDLICLRVSNLCPDYQGLDYYLSDGTLLASNLTYGETCNYIVLSPGTYTFTVRVYVTGSVILTVPNQTFYPGRHYTAYTVGRSGEDSLQMLTPLDGVSYINF